MKIAIGTLFFLCATAAFSQSVLSNTAQPLQMIDYPLHTSQHALAQEASLLESTSVSSAKGEVPLAELGSPIYYTPLGDVARSARKEHANDCKAVKVLED
jgi:hypothetical protein